MNRLDVYSHSHPRIQTRMTKKRKQAAHKPWCWYCNREFEDEKVLITHQKAKHFKCMYCHKKLNSASGLVIHVAQIHKENITQVPNAVEGHDTPEVEIFGMEGVPADDLQRHRNGLCLVPYKRIRVSEGGLLPLLAAQKASVPEGPDLPSYSPPAGLSPVLPSAPLPPMNTTGPVIAAPAIVSPPSVRGEPEVLSVVNRGAFDNIMVPPSMDPTGKSIPGSIIVYPDLSCSVVSSLLI